MKVTPLKIDGSWIIELKKFEDGRGFFYESFRNEIAKKYFEILPPISQSNEDMAYALVAFINVLFTKEQINSMNNHSAIVFLTARIKSNL